MVRCALLVVLTTVSWAQAPDGHAAFQTRCSGCHGTDGNGGEHAPSVLPALATKTEPELAAIITNGIPLKGMPGFKTLPAADVTALIAHMRTLRRGRRGFMPVRMKVALTDGETLSRSRPAPR